MTKATITSKSLSGGKLQAVMADRMFDDPKARAAFERACRKPDTKPLAAWAKLYGWAPPTELAEWEGVEPGYRKTFESISDVWMLGGLAPGKDVEKLVNDSNGLLTLLTGLCHFGDDPSGDSCFVSTLPHPADLAEIFVLDHEDGELASKPYSSLAQFVYACWGDDDVKRTAGKSEAKSLFDRMRWMWSFGSGEPAYHFAEDLARAPTFATWTKEKARVAKTPALANYWMLAHYFLGNHGACGEAVAAAGKAPGAFTPALAKIVGALLATPAKAKLGKLKPATLAALRAAVTKNAEENLLEPAAREAVARVRAGDTAKADPKAVKQRLAAGEDGWALIAEHRDDVATHDLVLAALAKTDKALAAIVKRYEQQRTEDIGDTWPSDYRPSERKTFDRRLSPVIGAAFRAGLRYDADHKRAASSLVNTLAFLDDDVAMESFAAAFEACRMDDPRLEYVVRGLRTSKHPRAQELLAHAAWRFFDFFEATRASMKKVEKEGATLDDLFHTHSHLLAALVLRLRTGDDESERLVDRVLSVHENMRVLSIAYASAFAQVTAKKLERHGRTAEAYCKAMFALRGERLDSASLYNLAEAALAFATLRPEAAEPLLRAQLAASADATRVPTLMLDQIACALAGLFALAPNDPTLVPWAERILCGRSGSERVYGPLRGIAVAKVQAAKPWIGWHVYADCSSNHIGEKPAIMRAARAALVALGEPEPPPFDERDELALARTDAELPAALQDRGRHLLDATFKRIVERALRSPEVVRVSGLVLRELFRYSADDEDLGIDRDSDQGLACMLFQGAPALPELASLLELRHMGGWDKTNVIYVMSLIAPLPAVLGRLGRALDDELLAALAPTPANIGTLDLAAAFAIALGPRAHAAIEAAVRWRFALVDRARVDHALVREPTANHLARIAAMLPNGKALLAELAHDENYHLTTVIEAAGKHRPTELAFAGDTCTFEKQMQDDRPTYAYTIAVDGSRLAIDLHVENIYVQSILSRDRYEQRDTLDASSPGEARAIADRIVRALGVLGFAAKGLPEAKKKRK